MVQQVCDVFTFRSSENSQLGSRRKMSVYIYIDPWIRLWSVFGYVSFATGQVRKLHSRYMLMITMEKSTTVNLLTSRKSQTVPCLYILLVVAGAGFLVHLPTRSATSTSPTTSARLTHARQHRTTPHSTHLTGQPCERRRGHSRTPGLP